jgi:hypothetical protein
MKKGFIKISDTLYKDSWKDLYIFLKDFRPTHIEFRHWENDIWYLYGISDLFDELKAGDAVPQYDVMFSKHEDNPLTYEFKRI